MSNNIAIIQNFIYSEFDTYFNLLVIFKGILHLTKHKQLCFECIEYLFIERFFHVLAFSKQQRVSQKNNIILIYRITMSFVI